jgi:hypothetical protein
VRKATPEQKSKQFVDVSWKMNCILAVSLHKSIHACGFATKRQVSTHTIKKKTLYALILRTGYFLSFIAALIISSVLNVQIVFKMMG